MAAPLQGLINPVVTPVTNWSLPPAAALGAASWSA